MSRDAQIQNPRGVPEMGQEMNIAQKLLKGSAEIDRMRLEIDQLISLLIGYLTRVNPLLPGRTDPLDRSGVRFNHGIETWIVGTTSNTNNVPFIELEVSPWSGVRTVYYSEWKGVKKVTTIESSHVKGVYNALPRLVEGLLKKYPQLAEAWSPLIKAAE
jgi:hypothetical protein